MSGLAELGRIAKSQQQERERAGRRDGRYLAGTGAASTVGGLGAVASGLRATHKDATKYVREHGIDTSAYPRGENMGVWLQNRTNPRDLPKFKGSKRITGGAMGTYAGLTLAAAGGAMGLANKRRDKKFQQQER